MKSKALAKAHTVAVVGHRPFSSMSSCTAYFACPLVAKPYQASIGSAQRVAAVAHGRVVREKVSSSFSGRANGRGFVSLPRRRLEGNQCGSLNVLRQSQEESRAPWQFTQLRRHRRWRVVPNPSFKLRPNGKSPSPGRRCAVHFRQPGLGASPSVPA